MSQCVQDEGNDSPHLGLWTEWCVSPLSGMTLPRLCPDTCLPRSPHTVQTEVQALPYDTTKVYRWEREQQHRHQEQWSSQLSFPIKDLYCCSF